MEKTPKSHHLEQIPRNRVILSKWDRYALNILKILIAIWIITFFIILLAIFVILVFGFERRDA